MSSLRESIRKTLVTNEESSRRQVSITVDVKALEKVDRIAREFSTVNEAKNFSRNLIIEMAINEYIKESATILWEDYGIDIEEERQLELEGEEIESTDNAGDFDLAVYPARNEGFEKVFLGQNIWYSVRIKEDKIHKINYVACYRAKPYSGITHYAKVKKIEPYQDSGKYILYFDGPAVALPKTVILGNTNSNAMRPPRYTTLEKLLVAKEVSDLF